MCGELEVPVVNFRHRQAGKKTKVFSMELSKIIVKFIDGLVAKLIRNSNWITGKKRLVEEDWVLSGTRAVHLACAVRTVLGSDAEGEGWWLVAYTMEVQYAQRELFRFPLGVVRPDCVMEDGDDVIAG
jgi:hypothetical protein